MPLNKIKIRPGINTQMTPTANEGGWSASNLIRWQYGLLQKIGGWARLFSTTTAGIVRAMHAYEDLGLNNTLLLGTDGGAQIYVNGTLYTFQFFRNASEYGSVTFTPTVGSTSIVVTDPLNGSVVGNTVVIPMSMSVGGRIIIGPTTVTVASVIDANNWTFNMALPAITGDLGLPPLFTFSPHVGTVQFNAHGLSPGNTLLMQQTTFLTALPFFQFKVSIPAGTALTVASVIDANNFTFDLDPFGFIIGLTLGQYPEGDTLGTGTNVTATVLQYFLPPPATPENWFVDNFGQLGLMSYTNGPIYVYTPPISAGVVVSNIGPTAPQINAGMFVAMPQAQIIAEGSEAIIGGGSQDPLLLRWCDAGDLTDWVATVINQAGSYRLSRGSRIIGGIQAPQTTLIWTDVDLWSMQYIGPPLVYGFTVMGTGCGLLAPKACACLGRLTYWMSLKGFFTFGDSGVQPFPCPVWDQVFPLIDQANISKCFAGSNSSFSEVLFFYPQVGGNGECSGYVKVCMENPQQPLWDFGNLQRSSWIDQSVFGTPLGSDPTTLLVQQHEVGFDADGAPMTGVYAETGFSDLAEGDQIMLVSQFIPDMKWSGNMSNAAANITIKSANYPTDNPLINGPFSFTPLTQFCPTWFRGRQIAMRVDWAPRAGYSGRMGAPRIRSAPAGRAP